MPDEHRRDAALLGDRDQGCSHLAHLRDATGRPVDVGDGHRLYRIDDQQGGADVVDVLQDGADVVFGRKEEVRRQCLDAAGTQPYLRGRLFTGDVERASARAGELRGDVENQRRLAHPRLAGEEDHHTRYEAAAKHPVELGRRQWDGCGQLRHRSRRWDAAADVTDVAATLRRRGAPSCSTVPQAWHSPQRPTHFRDSHPHSPQR